MRHTALAVVLALVGTLAFHVPGGPPPAAASGEPKVVIVVGAVHDSTSTYRSRAEAAYAEAIKYSSNVVKVYSPNATWAAVKAAMQGASIVIYMGHGNGYPSPYRTSPWPYTQNGFGLNKVAGEGDHNNVYYGEHYIGSEVQLAPNAVVLLHHLCYASGNGEPGHPEPTESVARQRADNYAAGFLKAGARAVIADGHMGAAYYLRALFTTRQTIDQLWRGAPNFRNNAFSFASERSPGYTVQLDPNTPTSGYYRSVAGRLDLQTVDVTGGNYAPTDLDPETFVVPGAASAGSGGAALHGDEALTPAPGGGPIATLAAGTRLRLLASGQAPGGEPVLRVRTLDGSTEGWAAAADLVPRDSSAPQVWEMAGGNGAFSPNGDGRQDTLTVAARLSESASWRVRFWQGDTLWSSTSGTGTNVAATWTGIKDGLRAPDGAYRWTIEATDGWGNVAPIRQGAVSLDTVAPSLSGLSIAAEQTPVFSPNGDGRDDTLAIGWQASEAAVVDLAVLNGAGTTVRSFSTATGGGAGSSTWDGRSSAGSVVADGRYTVRLTPRDPAGNVGTAQVRGVGVFASLSRVASSVPRFFPQDGDRFAKSTTLSFALARPATVTWQILDGGGRVVRTRHLETPLPAGTHTFWWNGTDDAGARLPVGTYTSLVTASDGDLTIRQKAWVEMNAFTIRSSDTTPARRQTITVTAITAEPLRGYVYLRMSEPGLAAWQVRMTKVNTTTWKATVRLRSSTTGNLTLRVHGTDADGRWQASYLRLPLH